MTEVLTKKCSYFNSGYCRYARREKGCKFYHQTDICEFKKCDIKNLKKGILRIADMDIHAVLKQYVYIITK